MTSHCLFRRVSCTVALLTSLLLCGCSDERESNNSAGSEGAQAKPNASATDETAEAPAPGNAADEHERKQRIASLRTEMSEARAEQTRLFQQRAETEARIIAHQEKGMEMLSSLKAQSRTGRAQEPGFEAKARRELESVLAQDNSMTAELVTADQELARVESRIDAIDEELESLRGAAKTAKVSERQ